MGAQQPLRRLVHRFGIYGAGQLYRHPLPERIPNSALVPAVAVALGGGIIPRVEVLLHRTAAGHRYLLRQVHIQRPLQRLRRDAAALAFQRRHKAHRMHPTISAGAAGQLAPLAKEPFHGILHGAADGRGVRLDLPAAVMGPQPAQGQFVSHGWSTPNLIVSQSCYQIVGNRLTYLFSRITPAKTAAVATPEMRSRPCSFICFIRVRPSPPW